jgi:hypothetical protein
LLKSAVLSGWISGAFMFRVMPDEVDFCKIVTIYEYDKKSRSFLKERLLI